MAKVKYASLLKDPKWQRVRLEILSRDHFTCQRCLSKEKTLHVHHKYYLKDLKPWEYDSYLLLTLCEECHEVEEMIIQQKRTLILNLKANGIDVPNGCPACGSHDPLMYHVDRFACTLCGCDEPYIKHEKEDAS